jgi:L-amino acid N-acyltransferase YncA
MEIRSASNTDFEAMWPIFKAVVEAGETYVFSAQTSRDDAYAYWFGTGILTYVAEEEGRVLGMYKLIANQRDRGAHVANASFMIDPSSEGKGIGKALGLHSLKEARKAGYLAMQFNLVVATNEAAIRLWQKLGFSIVGILPRAFRHDTRGYIDAYVMHRFLDQ